jgi:drug/metabolite transporter (DMT)-like permease
LPWTALLAYLLFAQVPDIFTMIGGVVIFGSALYIALRERKVEAERKAAASDCGEMEAR